MGFWYSSVRVRFCQTGARRYVAISTMSLQVGPVESMPPLPSPDPGLSSRARESFLFSFSGSPPPPSLIKDGTYNRPGALIAGAWATLLHVGESGYLESCRTIVGAARRIEAAIREGIPEIYVLGKPVASVVAFASKEVDIYEVGDLMSKRGWHCTFFCPLTCIPRSSRAHRD
jgi:hypothetical protein